MKSYLEGSLLVFLARYLYKAYKSSSTYKVVQTIKSWCLNSRTNKLIIWYLERKPTAEYTLSYRLAKSICKKLDLLVVAIRNLFSKYFGSSLLYITYQNARKESSKNLGIMIAVFSTAFFLSYMAINTIRGNWSSTEMLKTAALLVLVALTALSINRWKLWLENSIVYKLGQYFWE